MAPDPTIAARLRAGEIDWTTATSSAIAHSLIRLFGDDLRKTKLAAIRPLTASVLEVAGFNVASTARQYTTQGLIEAVVNADALIA
jgi:uroporphyrinogen III methyltransferase/synthase